MKLIGPWMSGYTRRVGITLNLLGLPFEHLDWSGHAARDAIRQYSPMGKVPALVLDDGDVLVDSSAIVDYLYELAGAGQTLLSAAGPQRRAALYCAAVALETYGKHSQIYMELSRPAAGRHPARIEALLRQVLTGFQMLEARAG
uniref:glutathione S-transferase family protein n=1 Tax=Rugamonas sp. TaxID=1926287 RepID=UPI0025E5BD65